MSRPVGAAAPLEANGVRVLPVQHDRLEYADAVREELARFEPDAVAVEIPSSVERTWFRAIDRLPQISVLLYGTAAGKTVYLAVHPGDPMVEAVRWARERKLPVRCADLDVDGYADYRDPMPDPYAVYRVGPEAVFAAFRKTPRERDPQDLPRECSMAYHAHALRRDGAERVLLVCGMHHADGVVAALAQEQAAPLTPPSRPDARLVHLHPESLSEVLTDAPFYVAAYDARRVRLPDPPAAAGPVAAGRDHGPFRVLSGGRGDDPHRLEDAVARAAREATAGGEKTASGAVGPIDRLRLQWCALREAERSLVSAAPDEQVHRWQRRNLARFTRNLASVSGRLLVDLFDLLAAARGCVSDNFAWELHRIASAYPAQPETASDLPTARIRADELFEGVRRLRLHRRVRKPKHGAWDRMLRKGRRSEKWAGEWLEGFDGEMICSYPPEDLLIEDFGRYLRRRGKNVLSEERTRVVPFTTSVLDGIDVRETIRNWHDGRIMVRELGRAPGEVGSVVVVLDDESLEGEGRFPYLQTWHGEHAQESDMAFYCTDPRQGVVGPGICRATYGGLVLCYPPRRMADVWTDPDYRLAETKSEVLLLAALDYSVETTLVYVAAKPPRSIFRQLASKLRMKLVYIPLGSLSPPTLRKIRVLHILSGHDKRSQAKDYIW